MIDRTRGVQLILLLLLAAVPGCMMVRGAPEIQALKTEPRRPDRAVPVHVDLQARVMQDGIHLAQAEFGERLFHYHVLRRMLGAAGVMSEPARRPGGKALSLRIEVEEERSGPTVLEVASVATLRILPSWTKIHYRVRVQAIYRGQSLPPFEAESHSVLVQNLLLFPLAPFYAPPSARARNRHEVVMALVRHLTAGLNALQKPVEEPTS